MSLMYAQMGMAAVSAFSQFSQSKHQHKMEEINRKYQETMSGISAAQQLNTLTANEISLRDAAVRAGVSIETQSLEDRAVAEVAAATAGVSGGSVKSTMRGLMRSRLMAQHSLRKKVEAQKRAATQDRRNVALSRAMNKDVSVIARPNTASALLGLGASMIDIYDSHQPHGSKTTDILAGWGR